MSCASLTEARLKQPAVRQVLQVTSYGPHHLGGLEACAEMLAKHLPAHDWSVEWAFCGDKSEAAKAHQHPLAFIDLSERKTGIPMPIPSPRSVACLWKLVRKSDFVLVHDVFYVTSLSATLAALVFRKPLVLLVHVWKVPCRSWLLRATQAVARKLMGAVCGRAASAIVTYNQLILDQLSQRFGSAKCYLIANGVHDVFCREATSDTVRKSRPLVVFAGRFVEKKGLRIVRQAAQALPEVDFLVCGSGPIDPQSWQLTNVSTRLATKDELAGIFQKADLLLLPSRGEGFPLVIQEAMQCGLPCAIFRETWAAWGRDPELFLLLEEGNWLQPLRQFLTSPRAQRSSQRIRDYAAQEWNWERTAQSYRKLFLQACPEIPGAKIQHQVKPIPTFPTADTRRPKPSFVR